MNFSRSLTSLRSVFMSLDKTFYGSRLRWHNKSWNTFYSTMAANRGESGYGYDSDHELIHLQLQIGSKLYPEHGSRSHAECFYNLRKSLGVQANNLHSINIQPYEYRNNKYVVGFDIEKCLDCHLRGLILRIN